MNILKGIGNIFSTKATPENTKGTCNVSIPQYGVISKKCIMSNANFKFTSNPITGISLILAEDEESEVETIEIPIQASINIRKCEYQDEECMGIILYALYFKTMDYFIEFEKKVQETLANNFELVITTALFQHFYPGQKPTSSDLKESIKIVGFIELIPKSNTTQIIIDPTLLKQQPQLDPPKEEAKVIEQPQPQVVYPTISGLEIDKLVYKKPEFIDEVKPQTNQKEEQKMEGITYVNSNPVKQDFSTLFCTYTVEIDQSKVHYSSKGYVMAYSNQAYQYQSISTTVSQLTLYMQSSFNYLLIVEADSKFIITNVIDFSLFNFDGDDGAFSWLHENDTALAFRFINPQDKAKLREAIGKCQVEIIAKQPFDMVYPKEEDREYIKESFIQPKITTEEYEEPMKDLSFDDEEQKDTIEDKALNIETIQCHNNNRAFVIEEGKIKAYQMENDKKISIKKQMELPIVNQYGTQTSARQGLLTNNESQMLLLGLKKDNLIQMDLNKQTVVREYDTNKNLIDSIAQPFKNAQTEKCEELMGLNSNSIFKFDLRLSKNIISQEKKYKVDNEFNCVTTTIAGGLAIGSLNGQIRLYSKVGQNAKNLIPGIGDPIKGIDVTLDGKWVLATTNRYLILLETTIADSGETYFSKTEKLNNRKEPKRLFLKSEDISKYKLRDQSFTMGKFNSSDVLGSETIIVSSIAEYLLMWPLKSVIKGKTSYSIKKMDTKVVQTDLIYKKNDTLLVTLPQQVKVQNKKMKNFN